MCVQDTKHKFVRSDQKLRFVNVAVCQYLISMM